MYKRQNKTIGSSNASVNTCAVRTGTGWESGTDLSIEIGGSGKIYGAGGNGGAGGGKAGSYSSANSGSNGGTGSSALGISYSGTVVNLMSGAVIRQGYGGGGGGGSSNGTEEAGNEDNLFLEHVGSGGGGGAGVPGGTGGTISSPDTSEIATDHGTQGQQPRPQLRARAQDRRRQGGHLQPVRQESGRARLGHSP